MLCNRFLCSLWLDVVYVVMCVVSCVLLVDMGVLHGFVCDVYVFVCILIPYDHTTCMLRGPCILLNLWVLHARAGMNTRTSDGTRRETTQPCRKRMPFVGVFHSSRCTNVCEMKLVLVVTPITLCVFTDIHVCEHVYFNADVSCGSTWVTMTCINMKGMKRKECQGVPFVMPTNSNSQVMWEE